MIHDGIAANVQWAVWESCALFKSDSPSIRGKDREGPLYFFSFAGYLMTLSVSRL
jgi:hypothetical protein